MYDPGGSAGSGPTAVRAAEPAALVTAAPFATLLCRDDLDTRSAVTAHIHAEIANVTPPDVPALRTLLGVAGLIDDAVALRVLTDADVVVALTSMTDGGSLAGKSHCSSCVPIVH